MKLILFKVLGGFKNHGFQRLEWVGKLAAAPPPNVARVPPPAAAPVTSKSWVLSVAARAAEPQQAPVAPGRLASTSQSWALGVAACTMYKLRGVGQRNVPQGVSKTSTTTWRRPVGNRRAGGAVTKGSLLQAVMRETRPSHLDLQPDK